jgi:hypothetical protein
VDEPHPRFLVQGHILRLSGDDEPHPRFSSAGPHTERWWRCSLLVDGNVRIPYTDEYVRIEIRKHGNTYR